LYKIFFIKTDSNISGFTTTCAISAYQHWCCEFEPRSGEMYSILHYVIKFVSNIWQVSGFLRVLLFPPSNKTDRYDITEILLKWALNTITIASFISKCMLLFSPVTFCVTFFEWPLIGYTCMSINNRTLCIKEKKQPEMIILTFILWQVAS
jgi:hypothetical protein